MYDCTGQTVRAAGNQVDALNFLIDQADQLRGLLSNALFT